MSDVAFDIFDRLLDLGMIKGIITRLDAGKVAADGVRDDEVAVCQALHEGRSTETVGAVDREVSFAENEKTRHVAHEVVVNPETAHGVVRCRVHTHRPLVAILIGNLLIHLEKVAVTLPDRIFAQTLDGVGKVKIDTTTARTDTATIVTLLFGSTGGDITGSKVTVARVLALKVVVTIIFGNFARMLANIFLLLRNPAAAVVSE